MDAGAGAADKLLLEEEVARFLASPKGHLTPKRNTTPLVSPFKIPMRTGMTPRHGASKPLQRIPGEDVDDGSSVLSQHQAQAYLAEYANSLDSPVARRGNRSSEQAFVPVSPAFAPPWSSLNPMVSSPASGLICSETLPPSPRRRRMRPMASLGLDSPGGSDVAPGLSQPSPTHSQPSSVASPPSSQQHQHQHQHQHRRHDTPSPAPLRSSSPTGSASFRVRRTPRMRATPPPQGKVRVMQPFGTWTPSPPAASAVSRSLFAASPPRRSPVAAAAAASPGTIMSAEVLSDDGTDSDRSPGSASAFRRLSQSPQTSLQLLRQRRSRIAVSPRPAGVALPTSPAAAATSRSSASAPARTAGKKSARPRTSSALETRTMSTGKMIEQLHSMQSRGSSRGTLSPGPAGAVPSVSPAARTGSVVFGVSPHQTGELLPRSHSYSPLAQSQQRPLPAPPQFDASIDAAGGAGFGTVNALIKSPPQKRYRHSRPSVGADERSGAVPAAGPRHPGRRADDDLDDTVVDGLDQDADIVRTRRFLIMRNQQGSLRIVPRQPLPPRLDNQHQGAGGDEHASALNSPLPCASFTRVIL